MSKGSVAGGSIFKKLLNEWPFGIRSSFKGALLPGFGLLLIALVVNFMLTDSAISITTQLFINLVAVLGFYIFIGTSGVPSFGHVAFMGIAAHLQTLLTLEPTMKKMMLPNLPPWLGQMEMGFWPAMCITVTVVMVFALLTGIPFSRMGDAATGIVTMCFLAVVHNILMGWETYTAGFKTLYGIPEYSDLWTAFGFAIVMLLLARFFRDSASGLALRASREDKEAAQSIGVNVANYRLLAWVFSAGVMGVAGVLLVHFLTIVSPAQFYLGLTFSLIAMLIVGGMSTVSGVVLGTLFMTVVIEVLGTLGEGIMIGSYQTPTFYGLTMMGTGVAIMVVMFWKPDGLIAFYEIDERINNWRQGRSGKKSVPLSTNGSPELSREKPTVRPVGNSENSRFHLSINNVSKNFGGLQALDNVSLELKRGEILGLIGPNGSGKTTLINTISGVLPVSSGKIIKDDVEITSWQAHQVAQSGIGRTFQSIQVFPTMTVLENVMAGVSMGQSDDSMSPMEKASSLVSEFGLEEYTTRLAGTLPYGPQRALEIARAVAIDPGYLLLDEPAAGMIRQESDQLMELLIKLRNDHSIGQLVVDHDLRMIMQLCDRVVVLNKGQVIAEGSPDQVQRNPKVIEAYIGRKRKAGK